MYGSGKCCDVLLELRKEDLLYGVPEVRCSCGLQIEDCAAYLLPFTEPYITVISGRGPCSKTRAQFTQNREQEASGLVSVSDRDTGDQGEWIRDGLFHVCIV